MFEHARANGVELVFVRIKRRRDALGRPMPEGLRRYNQSLDAYLVSNGAAILDMTDSAVIGIEHFAAGDHLNRGDGRRHFSRHVGEFLRDLP
jgi:hypothetical protein